MKFLNKIPFWLALTIQLLLLAGVFYIALKTDFFKNGGPQPFDYGKSKHDTVIKKQ